MKQFRITRYGEPDYEIEADRYDVSTRGTLTFILDGLKVDNGIIAYIPFSNIASFSRDIWKSVVEVKEDA